MVDGEAALRSAIRRRPDDWPTWLVFADRLTDVGDPRGQLILHQHALAIGRGDFDERKALRAEISALEQRYRRQWTANLRPGRHQLTWRHGFVIGVGLDGFDGAAVARFNDHPSALLHGVGVCIGFDDDRLRQLVTWPVLASLAQLDLYRCFLGDSGAAILASAPTVTHLTDLRLRENQLGAAGVEAIATSPHLVHLELLDLGFNQLRDVELRPLTTPGLLPNLRFLRLDGVALTADTVKAIVDAHPGCTVSANT